MKDHRGINETKAIEREPTGELEDPGKNQTRKKSNGAFIGKAGEGAAQAAPFDSRPPVVDKRKKRPVLQRLKGSCPRQFITSR